MKNSLGDSEIKPEDFDSFFLWKVFWKMLKQEKPFLLLLKVFLLGATLVAAMFFILLIGDLTGA